LFAGGDYFIKRIIAGVALILLMTVSTDACTVIVVTKGASANGSVMVGTGK